MIITREFIICSRCCKEEEITDYTEWEDLPNDLNICPDCIDEYWQMRNVVKRIEDTFWEDN